MLAPVLDSVRHELQINNLLDTKVALSVSQEGEAKSEEVNNGGTQKIDPDSLSTLLPALKLRVKGMIRMHFTMIFSTQCNTEVVSTNSPMHLRLG